MKENLDMWAGAAGAIGALLKGIKQKLSSKMLILGLVVGFILAWGTMGLLDLFLQDYMEKRTIILVSFAVGWVANELTDVLDKFIADSYEFIREYFKLKLTKNK